MRNEGWFWQKPGPSPLLLYAIFGTELIGTLIAVNGVWVTAISWEYAFYIWCYALGWFVVNDFVKMCVYKLLNREVEVIKNPVGI